MQWLGQLLEPRPRTRPAGAGAYRRRPPTAPAGTKRGPSAPRTGLPVIPARGVAGNSSGARRSIAASAHYSAPLRYGDVRLSSVLRDNRRGAAISCPPGSALAGAAAPEWRGAGRPSRTRPRRRAGGRPIRRMSVRISPTSLRISACSVRMSVRISACSVRMSVRISACSVRRPAIWTLSATAAARMVPMIHCASRLGIPSRIAPPGAPRQRSGPGPPAFSQRTISRRTSSVGRRRRTPSPAIRFPPPRRPSAARGLSAGGHLQPAAAGGHRPRRFVSRRRDGLQNPSGAGGGARLRETATKSRSTLCTSPAKRGPGHLHVRAYNAFVHTFPLTVYVGTAESVPEKKGSRKISASTSSRGL